MRQGTNLHARHLEGRDAHVPPSQCPALPEPLHGQGEGPPGMHDKHRFKPVGNKRTQNRVSESTATPKCKMRGHTCMHPAHP